MFNITSDWSSVYRYSIIPAVVLTIALFVFLPETYFERPPVAFDGRVVLQSSSERVKMYDEWNQVPGDSGTTITMQVIEESLPSRMEDHPVKTWLISPRALWTRRRCNPRATLAVFIQTILCLGNPLVFWVTLFNAVNFGAMMSIGMGYPMTMASPPYNLSARAVGTVSYSAALGGLLALPASYLMLHSLTKKLTLRNKGVRHAEFYLPAFVLPILSGAASVFLYGLAAGRTWHAAWFHISYSLNSFSYVSGSIASTIWVTESLPQWAAPGVGVIGGACYIVSWVISAALPVWDASWGVEAVNYGIGVGILLVGGFAVPVAFWGSSLRQYIDGRWGAYEAGALRPQSRRPREEEV